MAVLEERCNLRFQTDDNPYELNFNQRQSKIKEQCYKELLKLQEQRENELFCDVTLEVENEKFPAHKNVLAASSDYFLTMFTTDMKEKSDPVVKIETITARAMKEALNCIYTGHFEINNEIIPEVLHAASIMQLDHMLEKCEYYMGNNLWYCSLYFELATLYSLNTLVSKINSFFLEKFSCLRHKDSFCKLNVDKIEEILASDDLETDEESDVFKFLLNWVGEDLKTRKDQFPRLFKLIRLQFIPINFLINTVRKNELVKQFDECRDLVEDTLASHLSPDVNFAQKHRKCFASKPDSLILLHMTQLIKPLAYTVLEIGEIIYSMVLMKKQC